MPPPPWLKNSFSTRPGAADTTGRDTYPGYQKVSALVQQMTASIREIAHSANEAARVASDAVRTVESTNATVSKLGESLARLRVNPGYLRNRARLDRLLSEVPVVGSKLERSLDSVVAAVRAFYGR